MFKSIIVFIISMSALFPLSSNATLITFDDISGNTEVTNQYAALGVNFQQTYELDSWNISYAPIKHMGDHIAYGKNLGSSILLFDTPLASLSLLVTSGNLDLILEAYDKGDNLLTSLTQFIAIGDWHTMSLDLIGINTATKIILHDSGGYFAFDNVNYVTQAPEPSALALFALGLACIGYRRRKDASVTK